MVWVMGCLRLEGSRGGRSGCGCVCGVLYGRTRGRGHGVGYRRCDGMNLMPVKSCFNHARHLISSYHYYHPSCLLGAMPPTAAEDAAQPERPPAPFQTEDFRRSRPQIVGPDEPESPFPIKLAGPVQKGFGRGGKDLGYPTGALLYVGNCSVVLVAQVNGGAANLPDDSIGEMTAVAKTGVYYGYAQVLPPADKVTEFEKEELQVLPMVMSMGWNPFYDNNKLTAVSPGFLSLLSSLLICCRKFTLCIPSREISTDMKCVQLFLDIYVPN